MSEDNSLLFFLSLKNGILVLVLFMDFKNIIWNKDSYQLFMDYLVSLRDFKYQEFNRKIINTKYVMLGIKIPKLREIAKNIFKGDYKAFLNIVTNDYYELVLIKGLVISLLKDLKELNIYFSSYIELIDNWAICDTFSNSLKIVNNNKEYFINIINDLINKKEEYKVRLGLVLLLDYYVLEEYLDYIFDFINKTNSNLYYINMARAWLLCECFTKYPSITLKYLENNTLDKFTINKTISKINDSYRIDKKLKEYVLKFKK